MAFPLYFFFVVLQQVYATGYGIYFFENLMNGVEVAGSENNDAPVFSDMDTDCLDLTSFFFLNEVIVGALTFFQCLGLLFCSQKSKHLREIDGEDDEATKRVAYYKQQLEEKRISCHISDASTKDGERPSYNNLEEKH